MAGLRSQWLFRFLDRRWRRWRLELRHRTSRSRCRRLRTFERANVLTFSPLVEIDTPAAGAVYKAGQVVAARWSCVHTIARKGTAASGRHIATTPGKHRFSVSATVSGKNVRSTVAYTVKRKA
jgi:hypothetical protein